MAHAIGGIFKNCALKTVGSLFSRRIASIYNQQILIPDMKPLKNIVNTLVVSKEERIIGGERKMNVINIVFPKTFINQNSK